MVSLAVPFFPRRKDGTMWNRFWNWLERHEPKVVYGVLAASIVFFYLLGSVECRSSGNCMVASADLANWLFRLAGK